MWTVFKITNLLWLLISTYWWLTANFNQGPMLVVINAVMLLCLSMMPIKIRFDAQTGRLALILLLITLWYIWIDGPVMGLTIFLMYLPVFSLLQLSFEYKKDLLEFTTKWYAILLIPSLIIYWMTLLISVPTIGRFVQPGYPPYLNHVFYIETTWDNLSITRFNAFFLEPGHQALLSTFMMIANRFRFRPCPWLWVLLASVIFSFSLAGYLLAAAGFTLLKINTVPKAIGVSIAAVVLVVAALEWNGGDNALNKLIVKRMEYDDTSGIKGNNRFFNDTDFVYSKLVKEGYLLTGVKERANMDLVGGAGFKIYIINYGLIGVFLVILFYLNVIPPTPDYRYTIAFLITLSLCFLQRAYPFWYSWLFPYVMGIYIAKGEKDNPHTSQTDAESEFQSLSQ